MGKTTDCKHGVDVYENVCWACETNSAKQEALEDFKNWLVKHDEPANDDGWNRAVRFIASEIDRRIMEVQQK